MQALLFRHGPAVDREVFAASCASDRERPLSDEGRRRVRRCARSIRRFVPKLDIVATSPLLRARQTAEILTDVYGSIPLRELPALEPEQPLEATEAFLHELSRESRVALVGHRPDLETLASWLTGGVSTPSIELKKAGCALIDFPGAAARGRGVLRWLLQPAQLRRMR